jgi:hypothetical protein
MSPETQKLIEDAFQWVAQHAGIKAVVLGLSLPCIAGLYVLIRTVMKDAILKERKSPFVRMMEVFAAFISLILGCIIYLVNDKPSKVWIIFLLMVALGGWASWQQLKEAGDHDQRQNKPDEK